jgi:hypothetical protein
MASRVYRRRRDPSTPDMPAFWRLIQADFPEGCWRWQGEKDKDGYGCWRPYGKQNMHYRAHRFSYEYFRGPIPDNLPLDHLCNTPCCVHPYHVEAKTQRANVLRGRGISAENARKTHCKRGHPFDEMNTGYCQGRYGRQRVCRACGALAKRERYRANPEKYRTLARQAYSKDHVSLKGEENH